MPSRWQSVIHPQVTINIAASGMFSCQRNQIQNPWCYNEVNALSRTKQSKSALYQCQTCFAIGESVIACLQSIIDSALLHRVIEWKSNNGTLPEELMFKQRITEYTSVENLLEVAPGWKVQEQRTLSSDTKLFIIESSDPVPTSCQKDPTASSPGAGPSYYLITIHVYCPFGTVLVRSTKAQGLCLPSRRRACLLFHYQARTGPNLVCIQWKHTRLKSLRVQQKGPNNHRNWD